MPFCKKCKEQYPFGTLYCIKCGAPLVIGKITLKPVTGVPSPVSSPYSTLVRLLDVLLSIWAGIYGMFVFLAIGNVGLDWFRIMFVERLRSPISLSILVCFSLFLLLKLNSFFSMPQNSHSLILIYRRNSSI